MTGGPEQVPPEQQTPATVHTSPMTHTPASWGQVVRQAWPPPDVPTQACVSEQDNEPELPQAGTETAPISSANRRDAARGLCASRSVLPRGLRVRSALLPRGPFRALLALPRPSRQKTPQIDSRRRAVDRSARAPHSLPER
jgi:hypothetical protein